MFFFLKRDGVKYKSRLYLFFFSNPDFIRFSLLWKFLKAHYLVSPYRDADWQGLMNPSSTGSEPGGM